MKKKLKLLALAGAALLASLTFMLPREHAQTVETAGQKFKNIKVLNDMPADQLGKVMNIFAASLGVDCNFCHYTEDFAKDGKKEKDSAREMIQMTLSINKDHFNGRTEVSCSTCHNGREHPQNMPSLLPPPEAPQRPKQPAKPPTADEVFSHYVDAAGGDRLKKLSSAAVTAVRDEPDGVHEAETIRVKDGKYSLTTKYTETWVQEVWDGHSASKGSGTGAITLKPDEQAAIRSDSQIFSPAGLRATFTKLDYRFMDRIDGRDVYMLTGSTDTNARARLYFDVATGLLVRSVTTTATVLGGFQYQVDYLDYKTFDGIMLPTTIKYSMPNIRWTRRLTDVKLNAPVDDKAFIIPPPDKPAGEKK